MVLVGLRNAQSHLAADLFLMDGALPFQFAPRQSCSSQRHDNGHDGTGSHEPDVTEQGRDRRKRADDKNRQCKISIRGLFGNSSTGHVPKNRP